MLPHLVWLWRVDFVPLTYAGDTYALTDRALIDELAFGYVLHNLGLLAAPLAARRDRAALAAVSLVAVSGFRARRQSRRGPVAGAQCLDHPAIVAVGPPLGALLFHVYIKTDWGIPLSS